MRLLVALTPTGNPVTLSATAELVELPGTTVTVEVMFVPDCSVALLLLVHSMNGFSADASPPCVRLS